MPWGEGFIKYRFVGERTSMPRSNLLKIQELLTRLFDAISNTPEFEKVLSGIDS
jgi:hypothetical protein